MLHSTVRRWGPDLPPETGNRRRERSFLFSCTCAGTATERHRPPHQRVAHALGHEESCDRAPRKHIAGKIRLPAAGAFAKVLGDPLGRRQQVVEGVILRDKALDALGEGRLFVLLPQIRVQEVHNLVFALGHWRGCGHGESSLHSASELRLRGVCADAKVERALVYPGRRGGERVRRATVIARCNKQKGRGRGR
jgi:hypothetical protein